MAWPWKKDDDQDDATQDLQQKWGQMYDWYEPPSNTQAESVTPDIQKQWSKTYDWYTPSQTPEPEPPKKNIWQKAGQVLEQSKEVDPERVTGFQRMMGAEPTQDESLGGAIGKGAGWIGRNLWAGVGDFSNAFYRGLQSVGLDYVPGVKDALDYGVGATKHAQEMGDSGIGAQVIRTLPGMVPNMALTYMGGGAAAPAQLGANVTPTMAAVKGLATNPAFINSAIRTYGSTYGEAVDEGATRGQAIKAGLMNAIPSAMIEVGGGIEKLPEKAGQGLLKTIGETALEEGLEEVFQYPFEGMAKKATYAPDTPIFSLKDQAVINPAHMAHGGLVGGLAGGIFGGVGGVMNQVRAGKGANIDVNPELEVQTEVQTEVQPSPDFIVDPYGNVVADPNYQAPLLLPPGPEGLQMEAELGADFYGDRYGNVMTENTGEQLQLPAPVETGAETPKGWMSAKQIDNASTQAENMGVELLPGIPEGWQAIPDATTAPEGTVWVSNGKGIFDESFDFALAFEPGAIDGEVETQPDIQAPSRNVDTPHMITQGELENMQQQEVQPQGMETMSGRLAHLNPPIAQEVEPDYSQGQGRTDAPLRVLPGEMEDTTGVERQSDRLAHLNPPIAQEGTPVLAPQDAATDVLPDTQPNTLAEQETAATAEPEATKETLTMEEMNTPEYRRNYRQGLKDDATATLEGTEHANDKKSGFAHQRETMERNNQDVFGVEKGTEINEKYFNTIKKSTKRRTSFVNEYSDRIRALKLTKKESQYVQMLGEGQITEADLPKGMDATKIQNAIGEFRNAYNELLQTANNELVRNGYAPVEYRQDYFPHFSDPTDPFAKVMQQLGFRVDDITLPTDLAGLTYQFKPGKKWFGHFLERKGDKTTYDAVRGFERYLNGISDVIFYTEDIQKLRALETSLRTKYASETIQAQIDAIYQSDMPFDLQQAAADELLSIDRGHLGNYVTNLRRYTDDLAGKKAHSDRTWENMFNRKAYNIFDNMNKQVGKNMVNFNVTSWLTNFIPLAQAGGGMKTKNFAKGAKDTVLSYISDDGFRQSSTFLTNRKGAARLAPTVVEQISDAGMAPMELIDDFTVQTLTRGKYYDNIERGMSHAEAMDNADAYVAGAVADRSKGSMPTLFTAKNPINKLFTLFQLEVNNQYSFFLKDLPREAKNHATGWLAGTFLKAMVGSYLYNELYEKMFGRRAAFDIIGMAKDALKKDKPLDMIRSVARDLAEETPFIGGLLGGGRLPTSEALPDFKGMMKAAETMQDGDFWGGLGEGAKAALTKPLTFLASPIGGGNQARKTIGGLKAYSQGASITDKGQMRFPIEKNIPNFLKTAIAGQYSTKEGRAYFDEDRRPLSVEQTEQVQKSADPQREYDRILLQRQIDNLQKELKGVAKNREIPLGERDKRILELRNEIEKLRAAQR